jgi:phytoene/squalene synthetase
MFDTRLRPPIYSIYGFVRFADEIVDTFHDKDKAELLEEFKRDTYRAIERKISLNPVLQAFQEVVHKYHIERELIEAFLHSMEMDLDHSRYHQDLYEEYIYGSAEVIGLMCLRVFCEGDKALYQSLRAPACSLGSAFQKVNFLRDMKSDYDERERVYFPGVDFHGFCDEEKTAIECDIQKDFDDAYEGIKKLPRGARLGVYVAYVYYKNLLRKISASNADTITKKRLRVNDGKKIYLLVSSSVKNRLNMI